MASIIVWTATLGSMALAFAIAFWASWRFDSVLPRLGSFLVAIVVGIIQFSIACAVMQSMLPVDADLLHVAARKQAMIVTVGVFAAAYVGAWQVQRTMISMLRKVPKR
jgi:hypothetical protein